MNTQEETSLTKAADSRSVFIASTMLTPMGSVAFNGLENGAAMASSNPDYLPLSPAAEAQTVPGRQWGEEAFRFMAEAALDQGYISREGLERVCDALYGGPK